VSLPKIGPVLMFIAKTNKETRFYVTNKLTMTKSEMVKLYKERYWIELFHKDIKQHLGFSEMFMRSWQSAQKHWALVSIAYNLIMMSRRQNSFRRKIRSFRSAFNENKILNLYIKDKWAA
jgi:hypothetical protein